MVRNDIKKEFGDYQTPGYFAVKVCREEVRDMFDWMYATNISGLWWMWWLH